MKNRLLSAVVVLLMCGLCAAPAFGDLSLFEWAVNIDTTFSSPLFGDPVPAEVDASLFDDVTGLGTITVTITDPGDHYVALFVDHEMR